jgi:aquaporin Z
VKEVPYILSQLVGAFAASGVLRAVFPTHESLGATIPSGAAWQSFVLEVILSGMLMFVILAVSSGAREKGLMAGIAVGGVIGFEALFAGPICGASMNPARSLAPAIVSTHITALWVYLAAPIIGAALGVVACKLLHPPGCCQGGGEDHHDSTTSAE